MKHLTYIEPLEDRIAPATIISPYVVTYQDTNGDTAVVSISKPLFKSPALAANILVFTTTSNTTDTAFDGNSAEETLTTINLLGRTDAQDMSISVKEIPQLQLGSLNSGVDVGGIQAANFTVTQGVTQNIDLGNITIQGNLGFINVGDNFSTPALKSLTVQSMVPEIQGISEQSIVLGPILKMNVQGDFTENMEVVGFQFGVINNLTIGGTLGADSSGDANTGIIQFTGKIGKATLGNMVGTVMNSGEIFGSLGIASKIGSVHVLGSITGGSGADSGRIFANSTIGSVTVDGNVTGGTGQDSGEISGLLGTVVINGNLTGGAAGASGTTNSGAIISRTINGSSDSILGTLGSVTIGGNVTGGGIVDSGIIQGALGNVIIKGNLVGGSAATSGEILSQTTILVGSTPTNLPAAVGSVVILGNVTGGTAADSGVVDASSAKSITIGGSLTGSSAAVDSNAAILVNSVTSLTISGDVVGGAGTNSGAIEGLSGTSNYGSILIKGGVTGGSGNDSGVILVNNVKSLSLGKSLTGGTGSNSGAIEPQDKPSPSSFGSISIGGNLTGSTAISTMNGVSGSGLIEAGHIQSLAIAGNVTSGAITGGGTLTNSGAIRSTGEIGTLTIGGNITGTQAEPVMISAAHGVISTRTPAVDLAINTIAIGSTAHPSTVSWLDILAGYDGSNVSTSALGAAVDGSAQINSINLTGSLASSNIVAGALAGTDGKFGTVDDGPITTKLAPGAKSSIASVIISQTATGDGNIADNFGIVAESIAKVTVAGGANLATGLAAGTPSAVGGSNLFLLEVS
jgi:hypothetical protein